jgi:hypothetical protein
MRRWWILVCAALLAGACATEGSGAGSGLDGGNPTCTSAQACTSYSTCPGVTCKCPGDKFQSTTHQCKGGCCVTTCDEVCGTGGTGGTGGIVTSGGTGGIVTSGGAAGSSTGGTGNAAATGGTAGAGGSGGTVILDGGSTPATEDVHLLFFDAGATSGSYWGILRHAVKAKGSTNWVLEDVDTEFNTSQYSTYAIVEMVLDANGYPNVAYSHFRTKELRFRRWSGSAWVKMDGTTGHDVLDTDVDITGIAKHFIVMYQGKPEIAFRQSSTLKRYSWDGSAWKGTLILDTYPPTGVANPGGAPALTFDSQGYAHIAHHDHGQYQIHYAHDSASGWSNELLSFTPTLSSQYKLIALDASDRPHIVYSHGYTRWNGSAWVKADGSAGYDAYETGFISAGLSPSGEILMGHKVGSSLELVRKTLAATSWTSEGQVHPGPFSSAAFTADAGGVIHAVVSEGQTDSNVLVHLTQSSGGWVGEQVYTHSGICRLVHTSIALH